jgi:hypothetical protein
LAVQRQIFRQLDPGSDLTAERIPQQNIVKSGSVRDPSCLSRHALARQNLPIDNPGERPLAAFCLKQQIGFALTFNAAAVRRE